MTHIQLQRVTKFSIIIVLLLMAMAFVATEIVGASEVTGTLGGGTNTGSTITGTIGGTSDTGSTVSGTIGGTSGGSTVTGTVVSGDGNTGSGGGGGGGGGPLGLFGDVNTNTTGSVLGESTDVSNVPNGNIGGGAVLGAFTGVPNTGAGGGGAMTTLLLILLLSLAAGFGTYTISRRVLR